MKYFIVEGSLKKVERIKEAMMQKHISYTQKAMQEGKIFLSGLKSDESGGVFLIKCESQEVLENYLFQEPFYVEGIQTYRFIEFDAHYISKDPHWFDER